MGKPWWIASAADLMLLLLMRFDAAADGMLM
jgi:hypothetical protein